MARFETRLAGDFNSTLNKLHNGVMGGSMSASFEDGSDFNMGSVRCAVRVYERYSWFGKNRVSLSMTLVGDGDDLRLSAITSGGSQAVFFKMNTFGEEAFLDTLRNVVDGLKRG